MKFSARNPSATASPGGGVIPGDGVGSVRHTVPQFTNAGNQNQQNIVANGIAFSASGNTAYVSDTARGAIWMAKLKNNGHLIPGQQFCDETFHENVLCMANLYVAHPLLEGADGIALLENGTIIVSSNERNAILAILPNKKVVELFRNAPEPTTMLRNGRLIDHDNDGGTPDILDQTAPLEAPSSPFISGQTFCTTNAKFNRRDGDPNGEGEGAKVICLDQDIEPGGLSLPR